MLVLTGACGSGGAQADRRPLRVEASPPTEAAAVRACGALVAGLPDELDPGVHRRAVAPVLGSTAAWGDPAIVLRCGVAPGRGSDDPFGTDGVRWAIRSTPGGKRWSTVGRAVNVSVDIPRHYQAQAELVIALAPVIAATLGGVQPTT